MTNQNRNRRCKRTDRRRRKSKSKLVSFSEAVIVEGLAVAMMLLFFLSVRADVRHQQRMKVQWEAIRQEQQGESTEQKRWLGRLAGSQFSASLMDWNRQPNRLAMP